MRLCFVTLLVFLALSSCRCHMPRHLRQKADENGVANNNIFNKKSQRISAEGWIPCFITDQKKIDCMIADHDIDHFAYDKSDLDRMNQDDYIAVTSSGRYLLCGITTYGHLNCIGKRDFEKKLAQKFEALFQSFNLDSFYIAAQRNIPCGHDVDTDLVHCMDSSHESRCDNGQKIELHEKAKDFALSLSYLYIVNDRDEIEAIDICTKERMLVFSGSKARFTKVYSRGFGNTICGLTADHQAKCWDTEGASLLKHFPGIEEHRWAMLSMSSYLVCGILQENNRGYCIKNDELLPELYKYFKVIDDELVDIKVGLLDTVIWQTRAGNFGSVRYRPPIKPVL